MLRFVRVPMVMLLMLTLAVTASAQDKGKGKRKEGDAKRNPDAFQAPRGVKLSEEQEKKLADIKKEYGAKLEEATKKAELSADQRKAMREAMKDKKGKEAREAGDAAANLTADQKAAREQLMSLRADIRKAIDGILTDEQKAAAGNNKRPGRKNKPNA